MNKADDNGSIPTPQQVLDVLHKIPRCKACLPQVTPAIEVLTQQLNPTAFADLPKQLDLSLQALGGLRQLTPALEAYLPTHAAAINDLPSTPNSGQVPFLDDYLIITRTLPILYELAGTGFIQRALLVTNDPRTLKRGRDLAVVQMTVFGLVQPALEQVGIRNRGSASADSIVCRATAELINCFTRYNTTAQAVSSELRRQLSLKG